MWQAPWAADRRRTRRITAAPCPFGSADVADRCGQRPAKLSGHVFPESVRKAFGEHVGEDGEGRRERKKENGGGGLLSASWATLGLYWAIFAVLDASWDILRGYFWVLLGHFGATSTILDSSRRSSWAILAVLEASWVSLGGHLARLGGIWRGV